MGAVARRTLWLLLAFGCAAPAAQSFADALADGAAAYADADYDAAERAWRPLAERGDRDAQFALATLYQQGRGVAQDDTLATAWFRRAAEQGSVPAQFNLGNAYKHGRGVEASDREAFRWWLKAAEAGLAPAQFNVGTAYFYGRGVAQSDGRGVYWYRQAAANGHDRARASLERLVAARSAASEGASSIHPSNWVEAQPPGHFTVQLLAADSESAARRYIATLPQGDYALCAYRSRGKRWVAVLAGSFDSEAVARRAAVRWQAHAKPWIRDFAGLQAQLTR